MSLAESSCESTKSRTPLWRRLKLCEYMVLLMFLLILIGLLTPARPLVPPPSMTVLPDDSPCEQALRAVDATIGYVSIEKLKNITSSRQIHEKVYSSVLVPPGEEAPSQKRIAVSSLPEVLVSGETGALWGIHCTKKVFIKHEIPPFDFRVPIAWFKKADGTNRVIYRTCTSDILAKISEDEKLFEERQGHSYHMESPEDRYQMETIRMSRAIETKTDQELQADLANAKTQLQKLPLWKDIKTRP